MTLTRPAPPLTRRFTHAGVMHIHLCIQEREAGGLIDLRGHLKHTVELAGFWDPGGVFSLGLFREWFTA